ncbi:hypothetical protein PMAYCL1PPCAC_29800, partial [Pristionchus mayeri]
CDDPSESSSEGGGKSDTMTSSTTVLSDQFRPSICCSHVGMSNTYSSHPSSKDQEKTVRPAMSLRHPPLPSVPSPPKRGLYSLSSSQIRSNSDTNWREFCREK